MHHFQCAMNPISLKMTKLSALYFYQGWYLALTLTEKKMAWLKKCCCTYIVKMILILSWLIWVFIAVMFGWHIIAKLWTSQTLQMTLHFWAVLANSGDPYTSCLGISIFSPFPHQLLFLSSALSSAYFLSIYCKQYGPRSDCSQGSSLIRVHGVCFHDII